MSIKVKTVNIYTDGGARGNPGPAGIGIFIEADGKILAQIGKAIGDNTNNYAEYNAVLEGLDFLLENKDILNKDSKIHFFMDSQLIYSQISGIYKVKNEVLKSLLFKVREKEAQIKFSISYNFVPREKNKNADRLVNMALDNIL